MRKFHQILSLLALMILATGCATSSPKVSNIQNPNLPTINSIRTISSSSAIGLEWDDPKVADVDGFYIYRSKLNEPLALVGEVKDRFSTHYLDEKLEADTTYRYMIKTYAKTGVSKEGVVVSAKTAKGIDSVSFAQALTGLPQRIKLVWRPHANLKVSSYIIERKKPESSSWSKIAEVKGRLSAEYIDTSVKPNEAYDYRIFVKTLDGETSAPSEIISSHTKPLPDGVINLVATIDQPKKIVLSWDSPANENFSHYKIYSARSQYLPFFEAGKSEKNFYEDRINSNGATRYYKVTFVDKDGVESLQGNAVMGQTLSDLKNPVLAEPVVTKNSITLNWKGDVRSTKYSIVRSSGGVDKTINDLVSTTYTDRDVTRGVKYTYRVFSSDEYGITSSSSNRISVEF